MLAIALLSIMSVKAQTFVCTDVTFTSYGKTVMSESHRNYLKGMLGSVWTLQVFDNNAKISTENDGLGEGTKESYILSKKEPYKYRLKLGTVYNPETYEPYDATLVLQIQARLGYFTSCQLLAYYNGKLVQTTTLKRK